MTATQKAYQLLTRINELLMQSDEPKVIRKRIGVMLINELMAAGAGDLNYLEEVKEQIKFNDPLK